MEAEEATGHVLCWDIRGAGALWVQQALDGSRALPWQALAPRLCALQDSHLPRAMVLPSLPARGPGTEAAGSRGHLGDDQPKGILPGSRARARARARAGT